MQYITIGLILFNSIFFSHKKNKMIFFYKNESGKIIYFNSK